MKNKKEIKQRIQERRGKIKRERKKKFLYLRHTNQLGNYVMQKQISKKIKLMPKVEDVIGKLKWWERWYIVAAILLKRVWRKIFGIKKRQYMHHPMNRK